MPLPVLFGVGAAIGSATVAGRLLGQTDATPGTATMTATMAVAFTPLGCFVTRRLPRHPLGALMLLAGLAAALNAPAVSWSTLLVAAWLSQWTWWVPWALVPVLLLLFLDGQCRPTVALARGGARRRGDARSRRLAAAAAP